MEYPKVIFSNGVFVEGMEMPDSCGECPFAYELYQCAAAEHEYFSDYSFDMMSERLPNCPLQPFGYWKSMV